MRTTPYPSAETSYFWGQKQYRCRDVKAVTFLSTLQDAPGSAWDVSEDGDSSVLAWMVSGHLYVAANGNIAPNPNASNMFRNFTNLRNVDFGDCFDTSNVTNMARMFSGCSSLTGLDLSCFNTSMVTNMDQMFSNCSNLSYLNLSRFNVSKASMFNMFAGCDDLTNLVYSDSKILEVCHNR